MAVRDKQWIGSTVMSHTPIPFSNTDHCRHLYVADSRRQGDQIEELILKLALREESHWTLKWP